MINEVKHGKKCNGLPDQMFHILVAWKNHQSKLEGVKDRRPKLYRVKLVLRSNMRHKKKSVKAKIKLVFRQTSLPQNVKQLVRYSTGNPYFTIGLHESLDYLQPQLAFATYVSCIEISLIRIMRKWENSIWENSLINLQLLYTFYGSTFPTYRASSSSVLISLSRVQHATQLIINIFFPFGILAKNIAEYKILACLFFCFYPSFPLPAFMPYSPFPLP